MASHHITSHHIALHDCANETELLKKLDSQCLNDAAELFGVNLEWLQGASKEVYDILRFYKDNAACEEYLRICFRMTDNFVFKRACYLKVFGNNLASVILQRFLSVHDKCY